MDVLFAWCFQNSLKHLDFIVNPVFFKKMKKSKKSA